MLSRKATAVLLVVHAAAMLASQTEAFVPIFTYGEVQRMQEKERYKGQKKSLSVQQRSEEVDPVEPWEEKQEVIKLTAPVEIGMRMNSRQLEKYQATLEGLLREVLPSSRNGTGDPEPALCTLTQFSMHVLINPSTAARSREVLPRQPLISGGRGLQQGASEGAEEETQESLSKAWDCRNQIQDPSSPFPAPLGPSFGQ
ncbi:unnamed protein product [Rangifer tarandus platyrhynchus]|uniref:Promotilin n=2 Tax=Rangifer tarandus platyrhynchus TaxID=3082113 RepID=A0ABN8Z2Z2_RANTA|nr:unnamed protein product [Rangifer tarandus platyrhynchus]CAI9704734.1 unnamed protein product [Rangifer tarandus platyrhynchus]